MVTLKDLLQAANEHKDCGNYEFADDFLPSVIVPDEDIKKMIKVRYDGDDGYPMYVGVVYSDGSAEICDKDGSGAVVDLTELTEVM